MKARPAARSRRRKRPLTLDEIYPPRPPWREPIPRALLKPSGQGILDSLEILKVCLLLKNGLSPEAKKRYGIHDA